MHVDRTIKRLWINNRFIKVTPIRWGEPRLTKKARKIIETNPIPCDENNVKVRGHRIKRSRLNRRLL